MLSHSYTLFLIHIIPIFYYCSVCQTNEKISVTSVFRSLTIAYQTYLFNTLVISQIIEQSGWHEAEEVI
jgi:hypothetical protein